MAIATYKWEIDRYHRAIAAGVFDDQPVELLKGEIILMSPEGEPHACRGDMTVEYLRDRLGKQVQLRVGKPITILGNASEPEPDIAIVEPRFWEYDEHHPYPENIFWVIEFSNSSLAKDLGIKRDIYAEAGIKEYWIINLKATTLLVFRTPVNGTYQSQQTLTTGTLTPLDFAEIRISIDVLLGKERWVPE